MFNWNWQVENEENLQKTIDRCKAQHIILPTFTQLQNPETIPTKVQEALKHVDISEVHPLNLFRIHWSNDPVSGGVGEINALEIPSSVTGVRARIIGLVGKHFPTGAHKVGATYGCLAPYLLSGKMNPEYHKAVWPSTGNYCRGGAFNSALLGVHAVAILPEEMSKERFDWLRSIGAEVYATKGCESNVKEIYDKCHELEAAGDEYLILNQFDQFGNPIWHFAVTGKVIEKLFEKMKSGGSRIAGYVSATGSAGTLGAGDYLKTIAPGVKICASEALQCPTLLMNGFGGHRIEGIGDKHIPWVHNVKNTDNVAAIDDEDALRLLRLFNLPEGQSWLKKHGVDESVVNRLPLLGISSSCNLLSSIKMAKYYEMTEKDIIFTVFTDSVDLYLSRLEEMNATWGPYSERQAEIDWTSVIKKQGIDHFKELTYQDRKAIHNLKYFTWVEQQGKTVEELNAQWYDEEYWQERFSIVPEWDKMIEDFNAKVGIEE